MCCAFFFFKQKTAYEMRISDWSSDVCSSDIGKVAAAIAPAEAATLHYALAAHSLPARGIPTICVPTTAGTGSELSATNIFANAAGKKLWIWGQETKPKRVVLDRSEEHTSALQSLMRISYAVFCLKKK